MSMTEEQAKRCPRCTVPGRVVNKRTIRAHGGDPAGMFTMQCGNLKCRWYQTNWVVQVNTDGEVPERDSGHEPKSFPGLATTMTQQEAKDYIDVITKDMTVDGE